MFFPSFLRASSQTCAAGMSLASARLFISSRTQTIFHHICLEFLFYIPSDVFELQSSGRNWMEGVIQDPFILECKSRWRLPTQVAKKKVMRGDLKSDPQTE